MARSLLSHETTRAPLAVAHIILMCGFSVEPRSAHCEAPGHVPAASLAGAREQLKALSANLATFLAGSEEVFLETASRLAELQARAQGLVVGSAGVAAQDGVDEGDPADRMDRELARLEAYLQSARQSSSSGREALSSMLEGIEAIAGARIEFQDMVRTLRVIGTYVRIENARSGAQSAGMDTVAGDVHRLGSQMEPQFQGILGQADRLREAAASARATAEEFSSRQDSWSARMLDETRGALGSLRALAASQAHVTAAGRRASELVSKDVTQILVSLQTHDATRQALEHAKQELDAFEADACAAASSHEAFDTPAWLAEVAALCRLLSAQIGGARERLDCALGQIAERLRDVSSRVAAVGRATLRHAETGGSASTLEQVQRGLANATEALREHGTQAGRVASAMDRAAETVGGIAAHVRDLQRIGIAVKIIALNALVETERAGVDGRVLAVLARELTALAVEVVRRTTEVMRRLEEIGRAAGLLQRGDAAEGAKSTDIASSLCAVVERLREHHAALNRGVESVREGSSALNADVEAITRRLASCSDGLRAVRQLEDELAALQERATAFSGPPAPDRGPVRRSGARARYTMEAEREIHRRALEQAEPAAVDTAALSSAVSTDERLGDNVELF